MNLVIPTLGEEWPDRTIGEAAGEDFFFRRTAFAFEIAAWESACGGRPLTVIDGEREEFLPGLGFGSGHSGRQNDGFAELNGDGAIRLLGEVAGFDDEVLSPDGDNYFVRHVKERPPAPRNFSQPPRHFGRGE